MAMSLAQGGSGFPFFSPCVFKYLCGVDISSIPIQHNQVPDPDAMELLEKVCLVLM